MAWKPVGIDENGKFPARVEAKLNEKVSTAVAPKLDKEEAATTYAKPSDITFAITPKLDKTEAASTYAKPSDIQPIVVSELAKDNTAKNAAAAAVDQKLTESGVFTGAFKILSNDTLALSITDQAGNRSWLEVGLDGGPTDNTIALLVAALGPAINNSVAGSTGVFKLINDGSGVKVSFVDSEDRRSWLEIADDGGPTAHTISQLQGKLTQPSVLPTGYNNNETIKVASGPDIVTYGDSMTAADWSTLLASLTGRTVIKCGVGGESSAGIAARSNAMPYLMLPVGGTIPASGSVDVTLTSSGGGTSWPLLQGSGTPNGKAMGVLAGVPGEMTLVKGTTALPYHGNDDVYRFTRTTAGSVVTVNRPMPFYYDNGEARRGDIWVIWSGRNSITDGDRVVRDIKAMTDYLKALDKRFLVLSVHNGTGEGIGTTNYPLVTGINARLLAEYGRRFVDHRRYLIDYGLQDLNITPTSQDSTDIAADTVPISLRVDTIHQTPEARTVTANQVNLRLRELGWVV